MTAFLDTSVAYAFLRAEDPDHQEAVALVQAAREGRVGSLVTSDYVYDEAVTLAMRRLGKVGVQRMDAFLRAPGFATMVKVSGDEFEEARRRFLRALDRGLSLTDWTIVVQCERRGVKTVLSLDRGFDGVWPRNDVPRAPRRRRKG